MKLPVQTRMVPLGVAVVAALAACAPGSQAGVGPAAQAPVEELQSLSEPWGAALDKFAASLAGYDGVARTVVPVVRSDEPDGRATFTVVGEGRIISSGTLLLSLTRPPVETLRAVGFLTSERVSDPAARFQVVEGLYTDRPQGLAVVAASGVIAAGGGAQRGMFVYADRDVTVEALRAPAGDTAPPPRLVLYEGWDFLLVEEVAGGGVNAESLVTRGDPRDLAWHLIP